MADWRAPRRSSKDALRSMLSNLQHLDLTGQIRSDNHELRAHGGFCDVYQGEWVSQGVCIYKVAIKRLRVHIRSDRDFAKQLAKEIRVWSKLCHRNVIPLLGYVVDGDYPLLVSEWMANGTVSHYMDAHPETDLLRVVLGIAEGLEYLHDEGVIHSDIKADNVLVSRTGVPRICDFGLSRIIAASQSFGKTSTPDAMGSVRWMAPELLAFVEGSQAEHSMQSDVWAFGMTIYELLTKQIPFFHLKLDVHVMFYILQGLPPQCPEDFYTWPVYKHKLWSICVVSWNGDPALRKPMSEVVSYLQFLVRCADEDRYEYMQQSLHRLDVSPELKRKQPSILGQDSSSVASGRSQLEQERNDDTLRIHNPDPGTVNRSERTPALTPAAVENQVQKSRDHRRRAPSLRSHGIIRDFDLRGTTQVSPQEATSSLTLDSSMQAEHPSDLIRKWQESLPPGSASNVKPASTFKRDQDETTLQFLSPHDMSGSSRSRASSAGSSTIGQDSETQSISDNASTFVLRRELKDDESDLETTSNVPKDSGPAPQRTLRRRVGAVSRIQL